MAATVGKPGVPFVEVCDEMKTYDLLLFRGDGVVSNAIGTVEEA